MFSGFQLTDQSANHQREPSPENYLLMNYISQNPCPCHLAHTSVAILLISSYVYKLCRFSDSLWIVAGSILPYWVCFMWLVTSGIPTLPVFWVYKFGFLFWSCLILFDAVMFTTSDWTVITPFVECLDYLLGTVVLYNKHSHMDSTPQPASSSLHSAKFLVC